MIWAIDSDGVSGANNSRVKKFDSTGSYLGGWGSLISGDGQFDTPLGMATAPNGNVYVSDTNHDRIQYFNSNGGFLGKWGSTGSGDGQLSKPTGITVASNGDVYVIDSGNSRVQQFNSTGTFIRKWGTNGFGQSEFSFSDPSFEQPNGIDIDSAGNVYVSDGSRVQKFTSAGGFITEWGQFGFEDGQFTGAGGIAIDSGNNVYVTSYGTGSFGCFRCDVQKFDSSGNFLTEWGAEGSADGQFSGPTGIAIDTDGNVVVADTFNVRMQKFDTDGTFLEKWGSSGFGDGQFFRPTTVAAGASGAVYAGDSDIQRVQKFIVDESVAPPPPPTGLSVDPPSPGSNLTPKIIGTATAGTQVKIYTNASCTGSPAAQGSAATFNVAGIPVTVGSGSTTTFYATATNAIANVTSSCSTDSVTYTHEAAPPPPPAAPTSLGVTPSSPGTSLTPSITGTAEGGSTVKIYTNASCSGSPTAQGTSIAFGGSGIQVTVGFESTTSFYATATNSAGTSSCSTSFVTYTHQPPPPAAPAGLGVTPASPGPTLTPSITGTAEAGGTVKIYANGTCTGSPAAQGSASTFGATGIPVTVAPSSTTTFHATAANSGGTSSCSVSSVTYTHQPPPPPPAPTGLSVSPPSPGTTLTPSVIGTAEAGSTVKIYTNPSCTGSPANEGAASTFAGTGIQATVASGSTTTFNATATNSGGTSSCSISSATYVHQPAAPAVQAPASSTAGSVAAPTKKCKKKKKKRTRSAQAARKKKCKKKRRVAAASADRVLPGDPSTWLGSQAWLQGERSG